jgi:NAD(P)-dependent dehydrogenase (short-subunit alcohol dehydrogenase family)
MAFAREGAAVAVVGRRAEPLTSAVNEIHALGGHATALECDVSSRKSVDDAVTAVEQKFGKLDVIVNNAGAVVVADAEHTSDEEWDRILAVNLTGTFYVSRAALPALRRAGGGAIVNIGSVLGIVARPDRAAYCAAKSGVSGLTRAMALDHAKDKIRVVCICPSLVETELGMQSMANRPDAQAERERRIAGIPLGRLGTPEDVAMMAVYLASDEASWITGVTYPLDGGLTAY